MLLFKSKNINLISCVSSFCSWHFSSFSRLMAWGESMHNLSPMEELQKLLNRPYSGTTLPRKISFKNIGFARPILKTLNENLKDLLHHTRKDSRKWIKIAYKLFLANFVVCTFTRKGLSIAGGKKFYSEGSYLNKFFLTQRAVQQVVDAFISD